MVSVCPAKEQSSSDKAKLEGFFVMVTISALLIPDPIPNATKPAVVFSIKKKASVPTILYFTVTWEPRDTELVYSPYVGAENTHKGIQHRYTVSSRRAEIFI